MDEEYITLKQAAHQAGYRDPGTLHHAVRTGRLQTIRPAGSVLLTTRAWVMDYQSLVQANRAQRAQRAPDGADVGREGTMADAEEWVTVREAARLASVKTSQVHSWITWGRLMARPRNHGRLVSLAAVQALAAAAAPPPHREPGVLPPDLEEYVPLFVAARVSGVSRSALHSWAKRGKVASRPGPYGQLVRLADVLAVAAQSPTRRGGGDTEERKGW